MIIGKVIGGLGNQMFQYAFYRYISMLKDTELRLDLTGFDSYALHNGYELEKVFGIKADNASNLDLKRRKSKFPFFFRLESKLLNKNIVFGKRHILERNFFLSGKVFDKGFQDFYIEGYFQTERYLKHIEKEVRNGFTFLTHLTAEEQSLLSEPSVSIHIRGGDYLDNPSDRRLFGNICTREYYRDAIAYVKERVANPHFLVFSNDLNHAQGILGDEVCTIIDYNHGVDSYRDMFLMTQCQHNIIANSSFSWWGAWLNEFPHKIVVTPNRWTNSVRINQADVIPKEWHKIPS